MTGRLAKAAICVLLIMSAQGHAAERVRAPFDPDSGSIALRCGVLIDHACCGINHGAQSISEANLAGVDTIALRGDPLQDIKVLQRADVVIKGGLVFKIPAEVNQ